MLIRILRRPLSIPAGFNRGAWLLMFLFLFLLSAASPGQEQAASRLLFQPLIASVVEPRVGFMVQVNRDMLRLDIGNSIDLLRFPLDDWQEYRMAVGADFFTWTSLRKTENFHFPVDAVDYLFGINASIEHRASESLLVSGRLRLSHISAHLVDGRYDKTGGHWLEDRLPRVYSREFFDLLAAGHWSGQLRAYAGGQYVFHVDPPDAGSVSFQAGIEYMPRTSYEWFHPYVAYDVRIQKVGYYRPTHAGQAGVRIGARDGAALQVFMVAFDGFSEHGEYFDLRWSYWGPGLNITF